ncbi:hypothetical protein A2U01_0027101, partial [Trifolium medium]|nr:hypothetical protein [Trifolium medium]
MVDDAGVIVLREDGTPEMEDYGCFHFSWKKDHSLKPADHYIFSRERLNVEEAADYDRMVNFVNSFPISVYEDEDGNLLFDERDNQRTKTKFIDTKKLMGCQTQEQANNLLREISTVQARLQKAQLQPGVPADDFVLPPTLGHTKLFSSQTKVIIPNSEHAIMDGIGPEALRNEIADSTVIVFKLLEVVNFLNARECKYLK